MNHGPPGDIYVISASGGAPHRLTSFEEDDPTLAWSPDGYWLAMLAGGGLYLMPRDLSEGAPADEGRVRRHRLALSAGAGC